MRSTRTANKIAPIWELSVVRPRPEVRLAGAVLEDAIRVVVARTATHGRARRRREFRETRDWLLDDDRTWPFAFLNVCEMLALDPAAVRESLRDHLGVHAEEEHPDAPEPPAPKPARTPIQPSRREPGVNSLRRFEILGWDEA